MKENTTKWLGGNGNPISSFTSQRYKFLCSLAKIDNIATSKRPVFRFKSRYLYSTGTQELRSSPRVITSLGRPPKKIKNQDPLFIFPSKSLTRMQEENMNKKILGIKRQKGFLILSSNPNANDSF